MIVFHCKTILHTHKAAAVFAPVCRQREVRVVQDKVLDARWRGGEDVR
jgi:hypothetical protein